MEEVIKFENVWIDVNEELPNFSFEVIVCDKHGYVTTGWYSKDVLQFTDYDCDEYRHITHWMPLPKPPQK